MNEIKSSLTFDFTNFKHGLLQLEAHVDRVIPSQLHKAMEVYKHDAINEVPKCPVGSGKLVEAHEILPIQQVGHRFTGTLVVNRPYAASMHEGISRWGAPYQYKTPGTGAKWLEAKLLRHKEKYIRIATGELLR